MKNVLTFIVAAVAFALVLAVPDAGLALAALPMVVGFNVDSMEPTPKAALGSTIWERIRLNVTEANCRLETPDGHEIEHVVLVTPVALAADLRTSVDAGTTLYDASIDVPA